MFEYYLPSDHSNLLNGILLGTPIPHSSMLYDELKTVGLLHLVVLSGTNIQIINSTLALFLRPIGKLPSFLLTSILIIFFIYIVSPQAPIIRAAIMNCFTSVSIITGDRKNSLIGLLVAVIIIAFIFPQWISGLSFQLSTTSTLGIILFGKIKQEEHWILQELRLSFAASIFTVPLIFFVFHTVSWIAPFANLAVSWTIAPLMFFGFLLIFLSHIFRPLGFIISPVCYGLLQYMIFVIHSLSKIPFASTHF